LFTGVPVTRRGKDAAVTAAADDDGDDGGGGESVAGRQCGEYYVDKA